MELKIVELIEKIIIALRKCDRNFDRDEIAELKSFLSEARKIHAQFIRTGIVDDARMNEIADAI